MNPEPYLTVDEVAALLKVNHKTVYDEVKAGRLGCVRVGPARRTIRIPPAALRAWEAEQLGTEITQPAPKARDEQFDLLAN